MTHAADSPFPGAVGLTHLRVYDTAAPDGLAGGSPHVHLVCTEAYLVTQGHGSVQTLDAQGYREIELSPGTVVWFTPGVIHRLVNHDGELAMYIVMQNAGLPEAGDFVLTFTRAMLEDAQAYDASAALSPQGMVYAQGLEAAMHRRDLAVEGFLALRAAFDEGGPGALDDFYRAALARVRAKLPRWREVWEHGPNTATAATAAQLDALALGRVDHLTRGRVAMRPAPTQARKLGVCGTLAPYAPEGVIDARE